MKSDVENERSKNYSLNSIKKLSSGAEATIFLAKRIDKEDGKSYEVVVKERIPKSYRLAQLDDKLRRTRTRREARTLSRLPIRGPKMIETDNERRIVMEYIKGEQLKDVLEESLELGERIGEMVAKLHDNKIIHGDLTTSNIMLKGDEIIFIDFGLSFNSNKEEHKAVDLHLFRQALESKHHTVADRFWQLFIKGYKSSKSSRLVLERLSVVEERGRNKTKHKNNSPTNKNINKNNLVHSVLLISMITVLLILLMVPASAISGHMVLLTVAQGDKLGDSFGGTADLYLDIRPGDGQIFIDSFPLTKLDTQVSTRYANKIACDFLEMDCSRYNFFYTIRAKSTIVGGPSAGAAFAVLTAALLEGKKIDESIAITGTINSGGIIGPVAGEKEKVKAAKIRGLSKVLISTFSHPRELDKKYLAKIEEVESALNNSGEDASIGVNKSDANKSNTDKSDANKNEVNKSAGTVINLSKLYKPVNISTLDLPIVKVATLGEALAIFTGEENDRHPDFKIDPDYQRIMRKVSEQLCARRETLVNNLERRGVNTSIGNETLRSIAENSSNWYSLASYCFSDLLTLRGRSYERYSQPELRVIAGTLQKKLTTFEENLKRRQFKTLAELETYLIVSERVEEAQKALTELNKTNMSAKIIGFAQERYNSANVWSAFFRMKSAPYTLDNHQLAEACTEKVNEAEERIDYAELYVPKKFLVTAREDIAGAEKSANRGLYARCLFQASKAQGDADLITGTLSIPKDQIDRLVGEKLKASRMVIARQESRGKFPILGYSYYQYANSLRKNDPYSSLTFSEYALELSTLDLYFKKEGGFRLPAIDPALILLFFSGIILGSALTLLFLKRKGRR